jgi:hypothetical protein
MFNISREENGASFLLTALSRYVTEARLLSDKNTFLTEVSHGLHFQIGMIGIWRQAAFSAPRGFRRLFSRPQQKDGLISYMTVLHSCFLSPFDLQRHMKKVLRSGLR